jgi:hypothetical protein
MHVYEDCRFSAIFPRHINVNVMRPFILNHNLCLAAPPDASACLETALQAVNGNSGNSIITHALAHFLPLQKVEGAANIWNEATISGIDAARINAEHTHIFFIFQDQIQQRTAHYPWSALTELLERFTIPVIPFSLGANAVEQTPKDVASALTLEQVRFFKTLAEKSPSLGVRGMFTAEVLEQIGIKNSAMVGCPTFFLSGPGHTVKKPRFDPEKPIAATGLFSCMDSRQLHYFLQDEAFFFNAMYGGGENGGADRSILQTNYHGYSLCALKAFFSGRMHFFFSPDRWTNTLKSGHFSFAAGTRVHGAIMALNAGIPALCTSGDMRSQEMCALFNIPHRPGITAGDFSPEELYGMINLGPLNANRPQLYARFMDWLNGMGLPAHYTADTPEKHWDIQELQPLPLDMQTTRMLHAMGYH